ncbi:LytTR family transcriptional regulator DNA-binding domain-containing protein [Reichenbachiella sp. MALMAid0571]|uniref:LytR/AlgR family response regulator transcription factor n=1 Tax=Reichenbachiella sp. MALMAid0571 TaxID=3143939 RepID=UPI0032E013BA
MSKGSILIVEDEPLIADDLAATLESQGYHISAVLDEGIDVFKHLENHSPNLALLDVKIAGEMDGIQIAEKLEIPFIYLTSFYDQKTLDRAKKTSPSGYIVKPFSEGDLIANVEMAFARTIKPDIQQRKPEKLFLRNGQEIVSMMSSDIVYVEAFDNYANVYTEKGKFIISHTLKSIEKTLIPLGFHRIHRSYLINFDHIDSISENYVFLKGLKVQIGKSYRKDLMDRLTMI